MTPTPHVSLKPCPECRLGWWCSPECEKEFPKAHTTALCQDYKDLSAIDRVSIDWAIHCKSRVQLVICSEVLRKTYIPISTVKDWDDYHRRVYPDFKRYSEIMCRDFSTYNPAPLKAVRMMATEASVLPLTTFAALEDVYGPEWLGSRTQLCIHVVGAGMREMSAKAMLEEFLHQLPRLKTLEATFVGPEVQPPPPGFYEPPNLACPSCRSDGRSRVYAYENTTYHEYLRSSKPNRKAPDIIVALNTGFSEMETESWTKTLNVILDKGTPAVFTCYTEWEGLREVETLEKMGANIMKRLDQNKWRGVIPKVHVYIRGVDEDALQQSASGPSRYWNSNYRYVFRGRK
ncbi:hypothetical protein PQX77_006371 [Marasmius sp. AFHP31]|nr:hypothetical protein PQX77_006371 [Marasmius sp. AFHP31]